VILTERAGSSFPKSISHLLVTSLIPAFGARFTTKAFSFLENKPTIRVPVIAAIEGRAHVHSECVAGQRDCRGEGATFHVSRILAEALLPGDGIFTAWSYALGGRAEAFQLNPRPLHGADAPRMGVIAELCER